jgi:DNA-binding transcriptional LysR family regulator
MNPRMNELALMRTFVRLVERRSISRVAREIGLGQPTVSRHLKDLEAFIGLRLIQRTTRTLSPTDAGMAYYERAKRILALAEEARESLRDIKTGAEGLIRISCSSAFAIMHVCRIVFAFQQQHPRITVDLGLDERRVNLVEEGIDLAIRLGPLPDSSVVARKLGSARRVLVASPSYLARCGTPATPRDLRSHNGICFAGLRGADELVLVKSPRQRAKVPFSGNFLADHALAIREALLAGHGLGPAHYWLVADLVSSGRLAVILPKWRLTSVPLHLLVAPGRGDILRVRLLIEFLAREIATLPGLA